ncbi:MAG: phosphoenolpyruvate carboxykinase (GTP), partial [Clostridia bacterium]|nr:phosphoenolpyruvate carboxykinase (GTP) [Clostridia bacterium]
NVALDETDNTVWWEGMEKDVPGKVKPANLIDWKGNPWTPDTVDADGKPVKAAHPNSRFTAPAINCPCISSEFEAPEGVPLTAIVFGGRRAKTAPLVYEARDWNSGVFVGSIMASETTAAATGAVGVVRRDPMAMRPFVGYNMADYFAHWINMGDKISNKPRIFNVNWFRTDDEGNFIWPGFGDNIRVLDWILKRCKGEVEAKEVAIGYIPFAKDINVEGLDIDTKVVEELLSVDKETWLEEVKGIKEFYAQFGDRLPKELEVKLAELEANLQK